MNTLLNTKRIEPTEMKIGDHMLKEGFVYAITEIVVRDSSKDYGKDIGLVYGANGTYVSGDIDMFNYFSRDGKKAYQQGNDLAVWIRVA